MKKINEDNLALIISESIAKHITTENTDYNIEKYFNDNENDSLELDPYHTNFKDDDDSEIRALYGNDEEYDLKRDLYELMIEGENIFKRMREMIESTNTYALKNDAFKNYIEKLDKIKSIMETFWD